MASKIKAAVHELSERHKARKFGKGPQLGQQQTLGMKGGASHTVARGTQGSNLGKRAARDAAAHDKAATGAQRTAAGANMVGGAMMLAGGMTSATGVGLAVGGVGLVVATAGSVAAHRADQSKQKAQNVRLRGKGLDYQIQATRNGQAIKGDGGFSAANDKFNLARETARGQAMEAAGDTFKRTRRDPRSGKIINETVRNTRKAGSATAKAVGELAKKK